MKDFVFLHRPTGVIHTDAFLRALDTAYVTDTGTVTRGATWIAVTCNEGHGADASNDQRTGGAGVAALDNPAAMLRFPRAQDRPSDVHIALEYLANRGSDAAQGLLGAFGLVSVQDNGRRIVMMRDAIGIAPLYYRFVGDDLWVSSSATAISRGCNFDLEHIAEFLVDGSNPDCHTIYGGVYSLTPGSVATRAGRALSMRRYWSVENVMEAGTVAPRDVAGEFRALLEDAVVSAVGGEGDYWAELSGGVDSSSLVSVAAVLARQGRIQAPANTVSIYSELGWGDERAFSDAVVRQHGIRNLQWPYPNPFADPDEHLVLADTPNPSYMAQHVIQRTARQLRENGCRRLLSGIGPDHYLAQDLTIAADQLGQGSPLAAAATILESAVATRRSFWRHARRHVLFPLLPAMWRARSRRAARRIPHWLDDAFIDKYDIPYRTFSVRHYDGGWGHKAAAAMAHNFLDLVNQLHPSGVFDNPGARYPFLYRPLVEFALRLPSRSRALPNCNKLVLRNALADDLPDIVRYRTGKGTTGTAAIRDLRENGAGRIDALLANPILADLGCIHTRTLRKTIARAANGSLVSVMALFSTLALEQWLQVRLRDNGRITHRPTSPVLASA